MDSVIQFEGTIYEGGYGLLARKVMRDKTLKGPSKLIYAYMCSFASAGSNGERSAFPSVELQCAELNMSEDTYYRHRKPLIEKGYIKIKKQRQDGAKFDNNVYSIVAVPVPVEVKSTDKEPHPKNSGMEPYPNFPCMDNPCTENQGTKSNSLESNSFINKEEEEEALQLQELKILFHDSFGHMNKTIEDHMKKWLVKLPCEVIKHEIERAALNNANSWSYIETLLEEDEANNLRSIEDIKNKVVSFKEGKKKRKGNRSKALRTEKTPDWYQDSDEYYKNLKVLANNEKKEDPKEIEESQRKIDEMLAAFRNS